MRNSEDSQSSATSTPEIPGAEPLNSDTLKPISDGFSHYAVLEQSRTVLRRFGLSYSLLYALVQQTLGDKFASASKVRELFREWWQQSSLPPEQVQLPSAEALIFYSSKKPSWEPISEALAESLCQRGNKVLIATPKDLAFLQGDAQVRQPVAGYPGQLLERSQSKQDAVIAVCVSTIQFLVFLLLQLIFVPEMFRRLVNRIPSVWWELVKSRTRYANLKRMLEGIRPAVVITNAEHVPVAAELSLACRDSGIGHGICIFHENPIPAVIPNNAQEVWVWNDVVKGQLFDHLGSANRRVIEPVGRAELEFALRYASGSEGTPRYDHRRDALRARLAEKRILLYVSDFVPGDGWQLDELCREALRWTAQALRSNDDWHVVFKFRPFHHLKDVPGLEYLKGIENVTIPDVELPLVEYLSWDNVFAVAGCHSTALYMASGMGRMALRLLVSSVSTPLPVTDAVTVGVRSAGELEEILKNFELHYEAFQRRICAAAEVHFPYRGETLGRAMELLAPHLPVRSG